MSFSKKFISKSPFTFNPSLKEAAAKGKLDDNPEFKKAVESSGVKKKTQIVGAKDNRASQTVGVGQGYLDQLNKNKTDYMGNLKKYQGSYIQQPAESNMPSVDVSPDIGNFKMMKNSKNRKQSLAAAEAKASYGGGSLSRRQKIRLAKGGGKAERQLNRIQKKAARRAKRA